MAESGSNQPAYQTEDLQILTSLEPIRRHPHMYIGSTDARGLFHLLFEFVTGSLAEVVAGHGREVRVTLRADGSAEVSDDGRGPPNIEEAFTVIGTGHGDCCPYPDGRGYFWHSVANALSERLLVEHRTGAAVFVHQFQRGIAASAAQLREATARNGLTIAFWPDPLIFGDARFDVTAIRDRLRQLAFLHSGVRITFTDEPTGSRDEFSYADGIRECVQYLTADHVPVPPGVILIRGEEEGVRYEIGLQWCSGAEETVWSFANHRCTRDGGTHTTGLRTGITRGLHDFLHEQAPWVGFRGEDCRDGLKAVVSVWLADPMFESATWARLSSPEVEAVVARAVRRGVYGAFDANAAAARRVIEHVVAARDARLEARAQRQKKRQSRSGE